MGRRRGGVASVVVVVAIVVVVVARVRSIDLLHLQILWISVCGIPLLLLHLRLLRVGCQMGR